MARRTPPAPAASNLSQVKTAGLAAQRSLQPLHRRRLPFESNKLQFCSGFNRAVEGIAMRSDRLIPFIAAAVALAGALTPPAQASSCDREIAERIQMADGQACWTYLGAATTFVGAFSHGQRIAAQ